MGLRLRCLAPKTFSRLRAAPGLEFFLLLCAVCGSGCGLAGGHVKSTQPTACAECHRDITCQWQSSAHARAWNNPSFVEESVDYGLSSCLPCHAPEPILDLPPGEKPTLRSAHRADAVDCHACHASCGAYAGKYRTFGPHGMAEDKTRLPCSHFCGRCHVTEMEEYEALDATAASSQQQVHCAQCHMPRYRDRLTQGSILSFIHPRRLVPDHSFPLWNQVVSGGCVAVAELAAVRQPDGALNVNLTLVNRGAGHRIPTGKYGHREVRILVEAWDRQEQKVGEAKRSLMAGKKDALAPGEPSSFTFRVRLAENAAPRFVRVTVERVNEDRSFRYPFVQVEQSIRD